MKFKNRMRYHLKKGVHGVSMTPMRMKIPMSKIKLMTYSVVLIGLGYTTLMAFLDVIM